MRRRLVWKIVSLALFCLSLWFLFRTAGEGWGKVGERLGSARPLFLALTLLANLAYYTVWASRWRLMLRPVARVPWWPAQRALMASVFVNTVVPFARSLGGLVRATYLGRSRGEAIAPIYGITLLDQIGYSTMTVLLGAFFVPMTAWGSHAGRGRTILAVAAAALVAGVLVLAARGRGAIVADWVRRRMPGAREAVESGTLAARRALARTSSWAILVLGGATVWFCNVLTFALAARAVGADVSLGAAAAAWSIGSIVGVASGTPGRIGTTESAAVLPLIAQGVPAPAALAAVLLARVIQYGTAVTIGGACFVAGPGWRAVEKPLQAPGEESAAGDPAAGI